MKILMIAPTPFYTDRGCHIRIFEEVEALKRRGHIVKVVTYHIGSTPPGIDVERIITIPWYNKLEAGPSWHKLYLDFLLLLKTLKTNWKFRADIIHGHLHEGCFIGWVAARIYRTPLIFDYQGSLVEEVQSYKFIKKGTFLYRLFHIAEAFINRRADKIFVSASASKKLLVEHFHLQKERVAPLLDGIGIPLKTNGPTGEELKHILKIPKNVRVIAYVGSLTSIENIHTMLVAAKQVCGARSEVFFLMLGGPGDEYWRKEAIAQGLTNQILFTGAIPYADVPRYLAISEITWSAKLQAEANGKLYIYMWCGKPIVAFDHAINREILSDLGYYPSEMTAEALARELVETLDLPKEELAARGAKLKNRVEHNFSWDARALELEDEYARLSQLRA